MYIDYNQHIEDRRRITLDFDFGFLIKLLLCSWSKSRENFDLILENWENYYTCVFEKWWIMRASSLKIQISRLYTWANWALDEKLNWASIWQFKSDMYKKCHVIIHTESRIDSKTKNEDHQIYDVFPKEWAQSNKQRGSYEILKFHWHYVRKK